MKKRAAIIVLDSVGIGAMPDAGEFGDAGAHTLGNINAARPLNIPNLTALGIGNIENSRLPRTDAPTAAFGPGSGGHKGKGHNERTLGDGRTCNENTVPHISERLPESVDGRI